MAFEPNSILWSEPHRSGCIENLAVFSGTLVVTADGVSEIANRGDTIWYVADRPHSIQSKSKKARAVLIVSGS